jgi:HK97 family phage portal protein
MSLIKRAANGLQELRYSTFASGDPYAIPNNGSIGAYSATGIKVDSKSAMSLASVWTCVRILSTTIGSFPLDAYTLNGRKLTLNTENPPLIRNPFGTDYGIPMSRQIGIEQMMVSLLLRGNAYNYIATRDDMGFPTQMIPLNPDSVTVDRDRTTGATTYRIGNEYIDPKNIVHIPGMSMPGDNFGLSPIAYMAQTIGLGLASEEYGARFYSNGANMSGVIEVASDLDSDSARQLKERFSSRNSGIKNAHNVGVLTGGATFKPLGIKQSDMQFIETRGFNSSTIGSIFGVPPMLMGDTGAVSVSWGSSPEQQNKTFLTYTLQPWLTRIEESISNAMPIGTVAKFNTDELLRTDAKGRAAIYASARMAGWISVNEIRKIENMEPVDGGDDLAVPLNSAHNGKNDGTDTPPPEQDGAK